MGAQIQMYRALTRTLGGTMKTYGSFDFSSPYSDFETDDNEGPAHDNSVMVLAGETATLWEYGVDSYTWSIGMVEIAGNITSYGYLAWKGDVAVSTSNLAPAGTAKTWNQVVLTGRASFFFDGRSILTNPTAADHASDNSGTPTAWSDAGETLGYIYKVQFKNPGTTDLRLRRVFLG